jgi:hypothetical protein
LLSDGHLAHPNRFFGGNPRSAALPFSWTLRAPAKVVVATPPNVEGVPFRPAIGIVKPNDSHTASLRRPDQFLATAAVHSNKMEVLRVGGHRRSTLESPPLRLLSGKIPKGGVCSANLDIRGAVHDYLDCAPAGVRVASADYIRAALKYLAVCGS